MIGDFVLFCKRVRLFSALADTESSSYSLRVSQVDINLNKGCGETSREDRVPCVCQAVGPNYLKGMSKTVLLCAVQHAVSCLEQRL